MYMRYLRAPVRSQDLCRVRFRFGVFRIGRRPEHDELGGAVTGLIAIIVIHSPKTPRTHSFRPVAKPAGWGGLAQWQVGMT